VPIQFYPLQLGGWALDCALKTQLDGHLVESLKPNQVPT
jgi:hypothetical protein